MAMPSETPAPSGERSALRGIAMLEALKGLAALLVGIGMARWLHHDLHRLVLELVGHFGLDPAQHFPALLLQAVDEINATPLGALELLLGAYLSLRWLEAYGLWQQKAWGEWLGALSGGLYVPFELHHLWHAPGALGALVLAFNLLIVAFLARQLLQRRRQPPSEQAHLP
jgi:uncharacterized membrane protein (DUF2068 family)